MGVDQADAPAMKRARFDHLPHLIEPRNTKTRQPIQKCKRLSAQRSGPRANSAMIMGCVTMFLLWSCWRISNSSARK